jgi:hypothetical protein
VTVRAYRLVIDYPPGSLEPGWSPACWDALLRDVKDRGTRRKLRARGFRWPRERMFLSASGAYSRAALLRWYGAVVGVEPSEPVTWWEDNDAMDWQPLSPGYAEPETGAAPRWAGPEYTLEIADEAAAFAGEPATGLVILREQLEFYADLGEQSR